MFRLGQVKAVDDIKNNLNLINSYVYSVFLNYKLKCWSIDCQLYDRRSNDCNLYDRRSKNCNVMDYRSIEPDLLDRQRISKNKKDLGFKSTCNIVHLGSA